MEVACRIKWLFSYYRIVRHCESIVRHCESIVGHFESIVGHFESIVGQCEIQAKFVQSKLYTCVLN